MNLQVSREDLLKQIGYKDSPQPRLLAMVVEMLGLLEGLVEPRQAFRQIQDEEDLPAFLFGAVLKYAGAVTLGPKLEDKVKDLFDCGKPAEAYILDIAGSIAVTKAGNALWNEIREDAAAKGFKKGLRRTPGCRGIDLETQKWIFGKLADSDLGIQLTSSYMMFPRKSLSFLSRFGGKLKGTFSCKGCPQYTDCGLKL
ncbi:MAG TPA: hypothetical protein VEP29_09305 [Desulfatiglandales bacterium]|nr:hypothetical protein [Desulfatiglandales bacterium]